MPDLREIDGSSLREIGLRAAILSANVEALPDLVEPTHYDWLYVVRIFSTKLGYLDAKVSKMQPPTKQSLLDINHLKKADDSTNDYDGGVIVNGGGLDLALSCKSAALVIFNIRESNVLFDDGPGGMDSYRTILKETGAPDMLFRPRWVNGAQYSHRAMSLVMTGKQDENGDPVRQEQFYKVGVKGVNEYTGFPTPGTIDPKIENDGNG
jgi:hypothetical protein